MKFRISYILYVLFLSSLLYGGWRGYYYFFDDTKPNIELSGLYNDGYCRGDVACILSGDHNFGVSSISVFLDNKPLIDKFAIGSKKFDHNFTIPTKTIANGNHVLSIEAEDSTYWHNKVKKEINFTVDNVPLKSAFVKPQSDAKIFQGRTLHIQFQANKPLKKAQVNVLSNSFECFPESKNSLIYEAFIPFACEEKPNEYLLQAVLEDYVGNRMHLDKKFQVVKYPFKRQTLHLDAEQIKKEREVGASHSKLEEALEKLSKESPKEKLWQGAFYPPIDIQRVTTEFGVVRTTQERGRYMHKAVDVINMPKSVVWASQDGKVVMKERFEYSGNTVVIDHGYGILSLFFHLHDFADINVGDMIKRGNPIGTLGKTGYASGYHLHWEMRINNIPIDPMQWIKQNF